MRENTILILLCTLCMPAFAEKADETAPITIVITGSRQDSNLTSRSINTIVVDEEQLKTSRDSSVQNVVSRVPGVFADHVGTMGATGSVYLRGGDPNFTAVRIDGVQVNNPTNSRGGSFDLSSLGVSEIDRIEVMRGPLSALYGADALAGAINLFTKRVYTKPVQDFDAGLGEFGYKRLGMHLAGPVKENGGAYYSLSANFLDNGEPIEGDTFGGRSINGKLSYDLGPESFIDVGFMYRDYEATTFPEASGGPRLAEIRALDEIDASNSIAHVTYRTSGENVDHKLFLSWFGAKDDVSSPGVAPGLIDQFGIPANDSLDDYTRSEVVYNAIFSPGKQLSYTLGLDVLSEKGDSEGNLNFPFGPVPTSFELDRYSASAIGGLRYTSLSGVTVNGALRYLHPESYDSSLIPTLGLLYSIPNSEVLLKMNWSEGFKLPSFYALGNPIIGNPDLRPEQSKGGELGIEYGFSQDTVLSVSIFKTQYQDLVDFDPGPPAMLVNRSSVNIDGAELSLRSKLSANLQTDLFLTYIDPEIPDSGEVLRNRPDFTAGINIEWQALRDISINADLSYIDQRLSYSIPTGDQTLGSYTLTDLAVVWQGSSRVSWALSIDNLFDSEYEDAIGFPGTPRRWRLSIGF